MRSASGTITSAAAAAVVLLTTGLLPSAGAEGKGPTPSLMLNGRAVELDVSPTMAGDVVMVPIRFMSENIGFKVDWIDSAQAMSQRVKQIRIERLGGDHRVTLLTVGSTRARVNGEPRTLAQSPLVLAGRTLIPLREVARFYDAQVQYNPQTRVVFVSTPNGSVEPALRTGRDAKRQ